MIKQILTLIFFIFVLFVNSCDQQKDNLKSPTKIFISDHFRIEYPQNLPEMELQKTVSCASRAISLTRNTLGTDPAQQITIKIYDTTTDFTQETKLVWWKAAASKGNTIHLQPPQILLKKRILASTLAHEFAYFSIKEICGDGLPLWLMEGIASYIAKEATTYVDATIQTNIQSANFIAIEDMDKMLLSDQPQKARQAYWQTSSIVNFLGAKKGISGIKNLLRAIGQGKSIDDAMFETYHLSIKKLEAQWQHHVSSRI